MQKSFKIMGIPLPLARPRFAKGIVYDSQVKDKEERAWDLKMQMGRMPMFEKPMRMSLEFGMRIPKCSQKKLMELVSSPHSKRPDLSNLIKFVEDVALGVLYKDDSIVAEIIARKFYTLTPYTLLVLTEIECQEKHDQSIF